MKRISIISICILTLVAVGYKLSRMSGSEIWSVVEFILGENADATVLLIGFCVVIGLVIGISLVIGDAYNRFTPERVKDGFDRFNDCLDRHRILVALFFFGLFLLAWNFFFRE